MDQSWESWIQSVGGGLIQTATEAKLKQPFELQKMKLQAYGPYGDLYQEGMPNASGGIGLPTSWLLIGGALLVAVVLLKA